MTNLFDMLTSIQSQQMNLGQQMAKQFGLQQEQAEKAMEALMPAFSQGLKRNASTPKGFADFMQALATGGHNNYAQNPMMAFTPEGMQEGNAILGHLFGSREVSRAVAAQAEAASGVSQAIIKQMLPAMAPMVMGSLFQNMMGQAPQAAAPAQHFGGAGGNILGQILEQMMKGGFGGPMGGGSPQPRRQQPRMRNPLEEMLEQMMGGGRSRGGSDQSQSGNPGGPLGDIFNEMIKNGPMGQMGDYMGGGRRETREEPYEDPYAAPEREEPEARSERRSPYPTGTGLEDLFGDLFKPSKRGVPKQYEKGIQDIFDQFMPRKR